jgi:response regulator RpfG family c-di-GMP phosphodiesterase
MGVIPRHLYLRIGTDHAHVFQLHPLTAMRRHSKVATMKTIFLLDDESIVIKLLRRVLKAYTLIEATTAEQALRLFIDRDRQVDILVADVTLPRSSGIQVARLFPLVSKKCNWD